MVAEGDKVAARFTMRGTHKGTFFGVPPTGKKIEVKAINFYRLRDGQFVEETGVPDLLGLLQQIKKGGGGPEPVNWRNIPCLLKNSIFHKTVRI